MLGRFASSTRSLRERSKATIMSAIAAIPAGKRPAVKSAAIEVPVTEPMMISTRLGGIVSAIAAEPASRATSSLRG